MISSKCYPRTVHGNESVSIREVSPSTRDDACEHSLPPEPWTAVDRISIGNRYRRSQLLSRGVDAEAVIHPGFVHSALEAMPEVDNPE